MGQHQANRDISHLIAGWPDPDLAAIAVVGPAGVLALGGDTARVSRIASISKILVGLTSLVALEEGTITLEQAAGPPGSTVRHLLAHASGLGFDEHRALAEPGKRRIYSNAGIEEFADHLTQQAGLPFADYQHEAVIAPLGLAKTALGGSPAHGVHSCVEDLTRLAAELLAPTLVHPSTFELAVTPQFPDLAGVVPGLGSFNPNPWGLAIEIRGNKAPHWTAPDNTPKTFGHFGGTGTFLWVDPARALACVALSGTEFGPWALDAWPATNQAIVEAFSPPGSPFP